MARPASIDDLRSRLSTFHDRFRDRPPAPAAPALGQDPIPPPSRGSQEARNPRLNAPISGIGLPSGGRLPYPAAVYRAAAAMVEMTIRDLTPQFTKPLYICVASGPHVPGAQCAEITVAELLRGVADALEPPAGVPLGQVEP